MVWSIVSKKEMDGYRIPPVFQYYREVIGKENIQLAVVDESDPLDFVKKDDVVLLRTASKQLIDTIEKKGVCTTAEHYSVYQMASDKKELGRFLFEHGIKVPSQYGIDNLQSGSTYFVKPRYGSESFGITEHNICHSKEEVKFQVMRLKELGYESIIEDFIDGNDATVACYYNPENDRVHAHAIAVDCETKGAIQTHKGKFDYNEYCYALNRPIGKKACDMSREVFRLIGIRHHARIDFRFTDRGEVYLIDVNLLPGLGPSAHFSKCLLLTENISYADTIKIILKSAKNYG